MRPSLLPSLLLLAIPVTSAGCGSSPKPADAPVTSSAPASGAAPAAGPAAAKKTVRLDQYRGKVALVVNVASKCGFTPQYEGLEALYKKHSAEGFVVLGFPSDQFGHQEPGTEGEIKTFCMTRYSVSFPLFAKVDVNGPAAHPLYVWMRGKDPGKFDKDTGGRLYDHLAKSTPDVLGTDAIKWNFTKFLVDREGHVVKRFESMQTPESIEPEISAALAKK
jgi:glutathione peroxidase